MTNASALQKSGSTVRLDKWLWAARFFKTRSLARAAIDGGKVFVDGLRAKPSKTVDIGQEIEFTNPAGRFVVIVEGISDQRRAASIASALYRETDESKATREDRRLFHELARDVAPDERPNTQNRRLLRRLKEG